METFRRTRVKAAYAQRKENNSRALSTKMQRDSVLLVGIALVAALTMAVLTFGSLYIGSNTEAESLRSAMDVRGDIDICLSKHRSGSTITPNDITFCSYKVRQQADVDDFRIRRQAFFQHRVAENVILWLVVIITIAGVALAALQLLLSYRLSVPGSASMSSESELVVESGKLSLKSAYVGAIILGISFLFFFLFIHYVFQVDEVATGRLNQDVTPNISPQNPASGVYLGEGGTLVAPKPAVAPR